MVKPEVIHIGPYTGDDTVESAFRWNAVQHKKLETDVQPIWSDTDYTWFQNCLYYKMEPMSKLFVLHPKFEDKAEVSVLCGECGNTSFKISIAHYEVVAICTQCRAKDGIYSG